MKMSRYSFISVFLLLLTTACKVESQPIVYGTDGCHFCSMTIVDQQHAAEFVTKKGKAFKFDAVECMMNQLKEEDESKIALFLVNDYENPGKLIDASNATYLITRSIPSPMGEFLTAFSNKEGAEFIQSKDEGQLLTWPELKERFMNR